MTKTKNCTTNHNYKGGTRRQLQVSSTPRVQKKRNISFDVQPTKKPANRQPQTEPRQTQGRQQ